MTGDDTDNKNRCIALIGFRGCGKTTVGREIAKLIGGTHVDTDEVIAERAGHLIADIFETEGEAGFRRREADVVAQVFASPPDVVSVGGGAVLDEANIATIRAAATVVWLTAPPEVLFERISADPSTDATRPPLTDRPGLDEVKRLLAERNPLYARMADHMVDTSGRAPDEVAIEAQRCAHPA
jgi:shikimate kinase